MRSENFRLRATALQPGSPSGRVNFFNAICRLLMYEGSLLRRFSDLLISTDSLVCAESVCAGVGLRSASSVSIDPLQLRILMVSIIAITLDSRQVSCTRSPSACPEQAQAGLFITHCIRYRSAFCCRFPLRLSLLGKFSHFCSRNLCFL